MMWLARINGEPVVVEIWPSLTLDECENLAAANRETFEKLVKTLTPPSLAKGIAYRNSAGASFVSILEDILRGAPAATRVTS